MILFLILKWPTIAREKTEKVYDSFYTTFLLIK